MLFLSIYERRIGKMTGKAGRGILRIKWEGDAAEAFLEKVV